MYLNASSSLYVFIFPPYLSFSLSGCFHTCLLAKSMFLTLNMLDQNQETHRQGIKMRRKKKILPQVRISFYHAWPPGKRDGMGEKGPTVRTQPHHHTHMEMSKMFYRKSKCYTPLVPTGAHYQMTDMTSTSIKESSVILASL